MRDERKSRARVRGVDLAISAVGQGQPFLWGHGLLGSQSLDDSLGLFDWSALSHQLNVIRYDARGHGASEASFAFEDYQWPNLAADMLGVADALGAARFVAAGASMGCATALCAALTSPERVAALVLATPPTAWETRAQHRRMYHRMADIVESRGLDTLVNLLAQTSLLPGFLVREYPFTEALYLQHLSALNASALPSLFRGAGTTDLPPAATLRALQAPALILAWSDDLGHPLETAEELKRLLPGAELVVAASVRQVITWPDLVREFVAAMARG